MLAALTSAGGCSGGKEEDPVIATVDGLEIREDDYLRSYTDYLIATGQNDTEGLRKRHLEALVDAYLLGAEAERRGVGQDSALQVAAERTRRRLVGARFYEATVLDTLAALTEADVRLAHALGREQRVVRQLYFTDPDAAAAAYGRLEAGRPFVEEARALYGTEDPLAGSLGVVSYWQLDDAFAEAAFSTPVGEYSEPVRSRLGYHIVLVEDRIRNPVLTEDEFARRRQGVEAQLRLRRRRLEGDTFVRDFMAARNVAVNRPALLALIEAIEGLEGDAPADAQPGRRKVFTRAEKAEVLGAFGPETPLASYELGGQEQLFTVADYVFWIDELPFDEARHRTGASLGRALRNEVLARAGEAAGVGADPEVRDEIVRLRRLQLADALRAQLRDAAAAPADTARLARLATDLRLSPRRTVADLWAVPFASREAAAQALTEIRSSPARARSLPGFRQYDGADLREVADLAAAVRAAPLREPVLASAGEGRWAVVYVSSRRTEEAGSAAEALAPFVAEADLVRRLRQERPVDIDVERARAVTVPPRVPERRR